MIERLTRRAVLAGGVTLLSSAAAGQSPLRPMARPGSVVVDAGTGGPPLPGERPRARPTADAIIAEAALGGPVGFVVADAVTGTVRDSRDADLPLPPASTTKSVTALYALDALGADHRFVTRVLATGPVTGGVLAGDLVLAGGGDPSLDTDGLAALAHAVRATGLREVRGRFLVWGGALPELREIDAVQLPQMGYNPGVGGLNLNYNRVHFEWTRRGADYGVTLQARTDTQRPDVTSARMQVIDRSTPVYTYTDAGGIDAWTVARGALGDAGSRWLPVRRPAVYAADAFRALCLSQGLSLPEAEVAARLPDGAELARQTSAPLVDLIRDMLLYSTNLTAEVIGLAATAARGVQAATLDASADAMDDWIAARFGFRAEFHDHSGLGGGSRISAAQMVTILTDDAARSALRSLLKNIALVDEARNALPDPPGVVSAKTGTLNFVSCLAGYERTKEGADLAFAIFTLNPDERQRSQGSDEDLPPGASAWNGRSKVLQQRLLQRWGTIYGAHPE